PREALQSRIEEYMFARMRAVAVTDLALRSEHLLERAVATAEFTHLMRDPRFYFRTVSALREMRAADISEFAYTYLRPVRARTLYVIPLAQTPPLATGFVGVGAADQAGAEEREAEPYPAQAIAWIAQPPAVGDFRVVRLRNGLEVVIGRRAA